MSDTYSTIFSDDPRTGALTAAQLQARRQIAIALATRNRPYPKTIGEGLTALGEGLGEGYFNTQVARGEAAQTARDAALARPPSGTAPSLEPSVAPAVPRAPVGRTSMESVDPAMQALASASPSDTSEAQQPSAAVQPTQALPWTQIAQRPQMSPDEFAQRSARNETGGEKNPYRTIGPASRSGDHGYGAHQVMGENIPVWTKQYLGKEMTPQEFLLDNDAQDALAKAKGGEYLAKYGPNGAAAAWFAGENGMQDQSRPNLQAHVANYVQKFNAPLVSRDQVAASAVAPGGDRPIQLASLGGMPTSDTAPDAAPSPARDAIAQSLVAQQQPPPSPSQQVAQAQQVPTAQQMPISPPRIGPQVPAFPAYGDEPKMPPPTADMIHYRRAAADPYASDSARATFKDLYDRMEADQKAEFGRKYELWKAKNLEELKHNVTLPQQQEGLTRTYQQNLAGPQSIITSGQQTAPQERPYDTTLGTDRSPQRTLIPRLPPKPDNMSQQQWSELQGPEASKAVEAVQQATPQFNDAIKSIELARNHPGREAGLGLGGTITRQIPGTDAYAFGKINDQITGKTFLTAYPTLKGGGAISNVEGDKAQIAQAVVDPKQSPKDYLAGLKNLELQLRRDYETAQRKVNMPVTAWRKPGDNYSYAPDINQIGTLGGKRVKYIGGDPAEDASYQVLK